MGKTAAHSWEYSPPDDTGVVEVDAHAVQTETWQLPQIKGHQISRSRRLRIRKEP